MRKVSEMADLFDQVLYRRRRRVFAALRLSPGRGNLPSRPTIGQFKRLFVSAAKQDLRHKARRRFERVFNGRERRKQAFPFQFVRRATVENVKERIKKLHGKGFIYIFFGYKGKERVCLYVGRTRGSGGRIAEHRGVLRRNRVTQLKVFKVKNRRELGAAECLAIHGYAPLENDVKSAHPRMGVKCYICRRIRKAWKEFRPLASLVKLSPSAETGHGLRSVDRVR